VKESKCRRSSLIAPAPEWGLLVVNTDLFHANDRFISVVHPAIPIERRIAASL